MTTWSSGHGQPSERNSDRNCTHRKGIEARLSGRTQADRIAGARKAERERACLRATLSAGLSTQKGGWEGGSGQEATSRD